MRTAASYNCIPFSHSRWLSLHPHLLLSVFHPLSISVAHLFREDSPQKIRITLRYPVTKDAKDHMWSSPHQGTGRMCLAKVENAPCVYNFVIFRWFEWQNKEDSGTSYSIAEYFRRFSGQWEGSRVKKGQENWFLVSKRLQIVAAPMKTSWQDNGTLVVFLFGRKT